jgi:hypothetical protein
VTIGWAAQEQHFLKELRGRLAGEIPIYVVAGKKEDAEDALERIRAAGIRIRKGVTAEGGFSDCTVTREFERFFSEQLRS